MQRHQICLAAHLPIKQAWRVALHRESAGRVRLVLGVNHQSLVACPQIGRQLRVDLPGRSEKQREQALANSDGQAAQGLCQGAVGSDFRGEARASARKWTRSSQALLPSRAFPGHMVRLVAHQARGLIYTSRLPADKPYIATGTVGRLAAAALSTLNIVALLIVAFLV